MSIIGKPNQGEWQLKAGPNFGVFNAPLPDSLYMMEESSGNLINSGVDAPLYDSSVVAVPNNGDPATGDSYLAFTEADSTFVEWIAMTFGITSFPFTFAVIYRSPGALGIDAGMLGIGATNASNIYYLLELASSGRPRNVRRNTTASNNTLDAGVGPAGTWRLLVATYESADQSINMDDVEFKPGSNTVVFSGNTTKSVMGCRPRDPNTNFLDGDVAAALVWRNVALTPTQIEFDLWNAGSPWDYLEAVATGPTLSDPLDSSTGQNTSDGSVVSDQAGDTVSAVVTQSATTPTHAQIEAGQDHTGAPADAVDSVASAVGVNNLSFTGLDSNTAYFTHFTQGGDPDADPVSASGFTTDAIAAPVLSSPIDNAVDETSSVGTVVSDTASDTVSAVVTQSSTTPTHDQIVAGQDEFGAPADASDTVAATVGINNLSFTSLVSNTAYFTHFTQGGIDLDAVPVSATGFTTDGIAAPVLSSPLDAATGSTTAEAAVVSDTDVDVVYVVITQSPTTPTHDQIAAGEDHLGNSADAVDSAAGIIGPNLFQSFTGLTVSTQYYTHFTQDGADANATPVSADGFVTSATPAPVLLNQTDSETSSTTSVGTVQSNTAVGNVFGVVTQSAVTPTSGQIEAGVDENGQPADATDNVPAIDGVNNLSFTGLAASTAYFTHYTQNGGLEPVPVTASGFTTEVNQGPILDTPEPDQVVEVGVPYVNDISGNFSDPEGDPLTFSQTGLPNGLDISVDGVISGTPTGGFQ